MSHALEKALGKEWGCNLFCIVGLIFLIWGMISIFTDPQGPARAKAVKDCWHRKALPYDLSDLPDQVRNQIIIDCDREPR